MEITHELVIIFEPVQMIWEVRIRALLLERIGRSVIAVIVLVVECLGTALGEAIEGG